jgi:hypothetical protein
MQIGIAGGFAAALSLALALAYSIRALPVTAMEAMPGRIIPVAKAVFVLTGIMLLRSPAMLFQLLAPFCWLLLVMPSGSPRHVIVLRAAAALIGTMLVFYPFPVAGHQINIGALVCVIALSVLGHDVLTGVRSRWPAETGRRTLLASVVLLLLVDGVVTLRSGRAYLAGTPLGLPGTALIRLPPKQVESLRWVTAELKQCRSSYSMPGLFSFALWTGQPLPTPMNINHILGFIRPDRQTAIVAALRRSPDLCIVYSDEILGFFDRGQMARNPPLLQYIRTEFALKAVRERFAILMRKPARPADAVPPPQ